MRFKNYVNSFTKRNRILSDEDMLNMTLGKMLDNEDAILAQHNTIGFPKLEELQSSPNTQWVEPFVNNQGKQDGGYWQSVLEPMYQESFAPQLPPYRMEDRFGNGYRKYLNNALTLNEEDDNIEEESPIVLAGGVQEDVYLPKGEQKEDISEGNEENNETEEIPQNRGNEDEEKGNSKTKAPEMPTQSLLKVLEPILSFENQNVDNIPNNFATPIQNTTVPNTEPNYDYTQTLKALQNDNQIRQYQEEMKRLYKRMLEYINNTRVGNMYSKTKNVFSELLNYKTRMAQKAEIDDYLNDYVNKNNIPDEYKNALRHRAGSLLMAKALDKDKSQFWGNNKEILDLLSGHDSKIGSAIDAQNNYIGRSIYDKYKNDKLSDDELMNKIIESIERYNPSENDYKNWQNKDAKIPYRQVFDNVNSVTHPINKIYHKLKSTKKNHKT